LTDPARLDLAGPVALVLERLAVGAVRLVTVDGFSRAGKSRLTGRLAAALGRVPTVHLDFFYPGLGRALRRGRARDRVGRGSVGGRPGRWRRFDWAAGRFAEWRETRWAPVVVLEGCETGRWRCGPNASTAIWVDTPAALREDRLRARIGWPR
jgi:hypothetical protein